MKKAIALMLMLAVMLCGCGEAAGSYVNLASLPHTGYQLEADDAGNLYYLDSDAIYLVNGGEKTLFAKAADILPYMGNRRVDAAQVYVAEWYEGKFYIWDDRDDGIWEYDPAAGTSERLPVEFEIVFEGGLSPIVNTLLAYNGQLYIGVGTHTLRRYDMETHTTTSYDIESPDIFDNYFRFRAVDEHAMYFSKNRTAWKIDIASGERTEFDVSFIRETDDVIFSQMFLDGHGDIYYTTTNARGDDIAIKNGEVALWRGTTDNSAPCERIDLPTVPEKFLFDYDGWLYYRDADSIWRYDMKKERAEMFMTLPGGRLILLDGKIYTQDDNSLPHEYAILADLDALD